MSPVAEERDDAALLRAVARGDEGSLAVLYDRHAGWLTVRMTCLPVGAWPAAGGQLADARFDLALAVADWAVGIPPQAIGTPTSENYQPCVPLGQAREAVAIWLAILATHLPASDLQGGLGTGHGFYGMEAGNTFVQTWNYPGTGYGYVIPAGGGPQNTAAGYLLASAMTSLPRQQVARVLLGATAHDRVHHPAARHLPARRLPADSPAHRVVRGHRGRRGLRRPVPLRRPWRGHRRARQLGSHRVRLVRAHHRQIPDRTARHPARRDHRLVRRRRGRIGPHRCGDAGPVAPLRTQPSAPKSWVGQRHLQRQRRVLMAVGY
jgi:hypothetical protein